jgi:hypothetical protein
VSDILSPLANDGVITQWSWDDGTSTATVDISDDYYDFGEYLASTCTCEPWIIDLSFPNATRNIKLYTAVGVALIRIILNQRLPTRTPIRGEPNSTQTFPGKNGVEAGKTVRVYGPDGRAVRDIDYGDQSHSQWNPEVHDWTWDANGNPTRQAPRAPEPGDIP